MSAAGATVAPEVAPTEAPMLTASRDAPVGGQAVIEGVMMRGVRTWAVAVRKPAPEDGPEGALGPIQVQTFPLKSWIRRRRVYRLPVIRGVVALAESLTIGIRALGIAANAQLPPAEGDDGQGDGDVMSGGVWAGAIVLALVFAIGLFFVIPVVLTSLIKHQLGSSVLFWLVEGVVRTAIFLGYLLLLSRVRDLPRVV